ncbi:LOW QUALITY PROTEIN: claudin-8-like [Sphaerodactylus townsendi]|uniref:LOW QUALITY PROTEIN: claudin-8-like n=1 Tax=Sphaerodactylus townsendi TaxID=933632 RepID=UPI002025B8F0|nr:LOW QUALITY PROTEIN: claudin-8-like [Sphaerodactylus townsendi]
MGDGNADPVILSSTFLELHSGGTGAVGAFAITGMPQWQVTAFIENNIVLFEMIWECLWMNCIRQADIRMQCEVYDSLLALPLIIRLPGSALAFIAFAVTILGLKCTQCTGSDDPVKGYILLAGGIVFIVAGTVAFIPVSWIACNIIQDLYNPLITVAQKQELGEALYMGWTSAFCLIAGIAICCFYHCNEKSGTYWWYSMPLQQTAYNHHLQRSDCAYSKGQYI